VLLGLPVFAGIIADQKFILLSDIGVGITFARPDWHDYESYQGYIKKE
jgi:hypothetical protein